MKSKNRQILPNLRQISRDLRLRLNLARNLKTEKWCQNWRDPGLHHVVGGDWNAAETFLMVPFHALLDLRPAADRSFPLWVLTINRRSYDAGFTNMGGWGGWFPNRPKKNKSPRISPFVFPNFTKTLEWVGGFKDFGKFPPPQKNGSLTAVMQRKRYLRPKMK